MLKKAVGAMVVSRLKACNVMFLCEVEALH